MPRPDRFTLPLLLLLTLVAGGLRFVSLDRPSVWGDEAATYGRVAGSYQDLLDQLTDSSFPPLHYEMEWWIGQGLPYWGEFREPVNDDAPRTFVPTKFLVPGGIKLSPFVLRFVPALAGMLFVPAMYFLARQLFGPRVSLTAACLACFSAYALVYSRDAKMYMHFWLTVTLHVACLLWWLRTRRVLAWACWLMCGVAMIGLHLSGAAVLAIDAIIVLTHRPLHLRQFPRLTGLLLWPLAAGPALVVEWFGRKWRWATSPWDKYLHWPVPAWRRLRVPTLVGFATGVAVIASAALGPYGYSSAFSRKMQNAVGDLGLASPENGNPIIARGQMNADAQGIGWVAEYNAGRRVPDYLLYTASAYLTGWEWPRVQDQPHVNVRTLRLLQGATVLLLAVLAVGIVPWRRAFSPARARLDRITQYARAGRRPVYWRAAWVGAWLVIVPYATYAGSVARPANVLDAAASVALVAPPDVAWPRLSNKPLPATRPSTTPAGFVDDVRRQIGEKRQAVDAALRGWPAAWSKYAAAFRRDNFNGSGLCVAGAVLLGGMTLVAARPRQVGRGGATLVAVAVGLAAVCTVIAFLPQRMDKDVWLPRYIGVIFPAVLLVTASLVDRLPVALRWAALGLFVTVNLAQYSARVWGDSEPPTGLMAADVVAAQPKDKIADHPERPTFKAYIAFGRFRNAEPGGGTLMQPAGMYYLRELSGVPGSVLQIRFPSFDRNLYFQQLWPGPNMATVIENDLKRSPWVTRFVVWTGLPAGEVDQTDDVADRLRGQFKRVDEALWTCRDHWRWYDLWQVRRRTYDRVNPPGTPPATNVGK